MDYDAGRVYYQHRLISERAPYRYRWTYNQLVPMITTKLNLKYTGAKSPSDQRRRPIQNVQRGIRLPVRCDSNEKIDGHHQRDQTCLSGLNAVSNRQNDEHTPYIKSPSTAPISVPPDQGVYGMSFLMESMGSEECKQFCTLILCSDHVHALISRTNTPHKYPLKRLPEL